MMNPSDSKLAGNGFERKFVSAVRTWPWKERENSRQLISAVRDYPSFCGRLSREEYLRAMMRRGNSCSGEGLGAELEDGDGDDDMGEVKINGEGDGVQECTRVFKSVQAKGKSRDVEGEKNGTYQVSKRKYLSHNKIQSHEDFARDFHPSNESNASASRPFIRRPPPLIDGREKVLDTLRQFREMFKKVAEEGENRRVDLEAAGRVKKMNKWINSALKIVGPIPGVEVGDKFQYRMELHLIGLHGPIQSGIDYIMDKGQVIATSIVESGGYENYAKGSGVLIYVGQGGAYGKKPDEDQKLVRGNLALKNSISTQNPVRVTRKQPKLSLHSRAGSDSEMYMYDGLYTVTKYWSDRGERGKLVFKFQLEKIAT